MTDKILLTVIVQYRRMTDRETDRQTAGGITVLIFQQGDNNNTKKGQIRVYNT